MIKIETKQKFKALPRAQVEAFLKANDKTVINEVARLITKATEDLNQLNPNQWYNLIIISDCAIERIVAEEIQAMINDS